MSSISINDLEAQQVPWRRVVVGESETHDVATLRPHASTSAVLQLNNGQDVDRKTQPIIPQAEGSRRNNMSKMNAAQPQRNSVDNANSGEPTRTGEGQIQVGEQALANNLGPTNDTSDGPEPNKEPHMVGDFDGSSKALWNLFKTEAKSYDDARINTPKGNIGGALVFAALFSGILILFLRDSIKKLQVDPQDEIVYYLRQISQQQQLSCIAPQVSTTPTPPPPFPPFSPSASDKHIASLLATALIICLSSTLLGFLNQQWVREYMHVFLRFIYSLKIARLRQYFHEGLERWSMPSAAEALLGLLPIALILFFVGFSYYLLKINITVGLCAAIPSGIAIIHYIFTIFAPTIYPQSPYRNSFSGVIWYLFQKFHGRRYRIRGSDGVWRTVSTNVAEGQMELAMEETEERKGRDAQAIRWLIHNMTEDAEMERFIMAIPGSFNTEWGVDVWKKVDSDKSEDRNRNKPPAVGTTAQTTRKHTSHDPPPQRQGVLHELSARVARFLGTCKNRGHFEKDDWRKLTRACISTIASLVFCANANLAWFGDFWNVLEDLAISEKPAELLSAGTDQMFVMHWTCLSLVAIRRILEGDMDVRNCAHEAVNSLAGEDDTGNAQALVGAQRINETLEDAKDCLHRIYIVLSKSRETENLEEVRGILRNRVLLSEISKLENINIHNEAGHLENVDHWISATQYSVAHHITSQIPGVPNDFDPLVPFSHLVEHVRDPRKLQFIRPGQILRSLCSVGTTLRNVLKGQGDVEAYKQVQKDLGQLFLGVVLRDGNEVLRQLWRLQDLRHGCGFGFTVELFFISLSQLLSTSSSNNSHSSLYTGTFRAITSDWSKHQNSHGTRRLLLDVALSHRFMFQDGYPDYIVNEYLDLMGNFFKGQDGYIDEAVQQLGSFKSYTNAPFWHRLLNVLISARAA